MTSMLRICGRSLLTRGRAALHVMLAAAAGAAMCYPAHAAGPKVGQTVAAYEAKTLDGRVIDSQALKGKVTLVHFWATWCTPCLEEMPALDTFYREHHRQGFEVVAISVDDAADEPKVREFTERFAFPVAMKGASRIDGFGRLWALPMSFLIDRHQVLRKVDWTGPERIDAALLDKLVTPLLPRASRPQTGDR